MRKWSHIRDSYWTSERKIEHQIQNGLQTSRHYKHHAQLSFLRKNANSNTPIDIMESGGTAQRNGEDCANDGVSYNQYGYNMVQVNEDQVDESSTLSNYSSTLSNYSSTLSNYSSTLSNNDQHEIQSTSKLPVLDATWMQFMDSFPSQAEPTNRHISFFNGLVPTLDKFDDDQVLDFQLGVIKLMKEIKNNSTTQQQTVISSPQQGSSSCHSIEYDGSHGASDIPNTQYVYSSDSNNPVTQVSQGFHDSSSY